MTQDYKPSAGEINELRAAPRADIPKNCQLDEEPGLCPSPCVFDDPEECINNCLYACNLQASGKPKTDCKYYRLSLAQPEPEAPTKAEIHALADELLDGDRASRVDFARAVLARWGNL
jgi:hypothetical protein